MGRPIRADVHRGRPAEDVGGAVTRVIVKKRPASLQLVLEVRQSQAGRDPAPFVVAPSNGQGHRETGRYDNRSRPDLDVHLVDLPRGQRLLLVVGVVRAKWPCQFSIDLAVGGAQPALGNRGVGIYGSLEGDLLASGVEHAKDQEEVGIDSR